MATSLEADICARKEKLLATKTTVTTPDGKRLIEERKDGGEPSVSGAGPSTSYGFVVDTKPDLEVAKIVPGLYIGSQDVAQDEELLKEHKINHVLSLGIRVQHFDLITYTFMEFLDLPQFDLFPHIQYCYDIIDSIRSQNKNIFVHCNAGISRSATVVIYYLIKKYKMNYNEALGHVKGARSVAKPNEGFAKQLQAVEYPTKPSTSGASSSASSSGASSSH